MELLDCVRLTWLDSSNSDSHYCSCYCTSSWLIWNILHLYLQPGSLPCVSQTTLKLWSRFTSKGILYRSTRWS